MIVVIVVVWLVLSVIIGRDYCFFLDQVRSPATLSYPADPLLLPTRDRDRDHNSIVLDCRFPFAIPYQKRGGESNVIRASRHCNHSHSWSKNVARHSGAIIHMLAQWLVLNRAQQRRYSTRHGRHDRCACLWTTTHGMPLRSKQMRILACMKGRKRCHLELGLSEIQHTSHCLQKAAKVAIFPV